MKNFISKIIFILSDIVIISLAIYLAYILHLSFKSVDLDTFPLIKYLSFYPLYIFPILLFSYEGIYTYRYDFWHESRLILKVTILSIILIFSYLAMTKTTENYSRFVIGFTFVIMAVLVPLFKNICKKLLFKLGAWQKTAKIHGEDAFLTKEIYRNPYLGYIQPKPDEEATTIFINSKDSDPEDLKRLISLHIQNKHEVVFIPLVDDYDLTYSHIYGLSNTRTNLIVFKNRLKSSYQLLFKRISDLLLSLIFFPFLLLIMLYIAYRIKRTEPQKDIFFTQERLGKNGVPFVCYKFRTMYENSEDLLQQYLQEHPEEIEYYNAYHKYKNDPRITKIGQWLRRTSLDELPQIFNVFKNEMSLIGPRPYMLNEKEKIGENVDTILTVKPGVTGLWQVSGRSDLDFISRVRLDTWYLRNWNLWMDLVILIKTVKTVLFKDGAK